VPHLAGNFAPVTDEVTAHDLPVTGSIPKELTGWYLRNGPNPHEATAAHWFLGSGMVHGVRLEAGRATAFRNRWVRTSSYTKGATVYDAFGNRDLTAGPCNTHVIRHAGRILSLAESSLPYLLTPELDTVGVHDFGGKLTTAMTAHPKTCPVTGELHFFGYGMLTAPFLTYHRADRDGNLTVSRPVDEVAGATMMHDFALTAEHVVFMDLPVVFDILLAMSGNAMPYKWDPSYGARVGVLRRDTPHGKVRWFDIDPCYVFHVSNAYDDGDTVVLDVVRYPELWVEESGDPYPPASLWRWTVDLADEKVIEEQLDDRNTEFPRIDDRLEGSNARYVHTTVAASHPRHDPVPGALLRYDMYTGGVTEHVFGPGRIPSEAVFAPADDRPGGAGWLMTYVYDVSTDTSDLVIVDAGDMGKPPVATIHLPQRVPYGFHGSWLPDPGA
jgi:carotenoid cleavage dioxygenase